jgi:hypothetical protein
MLPVMRSLVFVLTLLLTTTAFADPARVSREYVEARTAEIFAGGCIMNSEAETAGRQAILAWRVTAGRIDGVTLDGLTVAAAVAGDRNLGMRELGGEAPQVVRAVITVDARANEAQRHALVQLARDLSGSLITDVVRVDIAPISFVSSERSVEVEVPETLRLSVNKTVAHDPSCGAMQWFTPFSRRLVAPAMGTADAHAFTGTGLNSRWSAPHKKSAFFAAFTY